MLNTIVYFILIHISDYKQVYSKYRNGMPITYNMPLISGQVMWITMMNEKIETPVKIFLVKFKTHKNNQLIN